MGRRKNEPGKKKREEPDDEGSGKVEEEEQHSSDLEGREEDEEYIVDIDDPMKVRQVRCWWRCCRYLYIIWSE